MVNFIIKKKNKLKQISRWQLKNEGFLFNPHIKKDNLIKIDSLTIYDNKIIKYILSKKIDNEFRKLTSLVLNALNDEESSDNGNICIALNELTKMKSNIMNKYKLYIEKLEYDKYLKRLKLYEKELKEKIVLREQKEESKSR